MYVILAGAAVSVLVFGLLRLRRRPAVASEHEQPIDDKTAVVAARLEHIASNLEAQAVALRSTVAEVTAERKAGT